MRGRFRVRAGVIDIISTAGLQLGGFVDCRALCAAQCWTTWYVTLLCTRPQRVSKTCNVRGESTQKISACSRLYT